MAAGTACSGQDGLKETNARTYRPLCFALCRFSCITNKRDFPRSHKREAQIESEMKCHITQANEKQYTATLR